MKKQSAFIALTMATGLATGLQSAMAQMETNVGEIELLDVDGQHQPALLLDTKISGQVSGLVANITVTQTFKNELDSWVHGRYVFPMPENSVMSSLKLLVGDREITAQIQEKKQAQQIYQQAKQEGKKAALAEQHRENLFSVNIANIAPSETIQAKITYIDKVSYKNSSFELRLPTTLTPRYIAGQALRLEPKEMNSEVELVNGWAADTLQVPDASQITPPQQHPSEQSRDHRFELDLLVNPGISINQIQSPSHTLKTDFTSHQGIQVALQHGRDLMNRDLVLRWQARDPSEAQAAIFQQKFDKDHYSLLMVTPPAAGAVALPRDVTFIIDTSGSMAGTSIQQAKLSLASALDDLTVNDRFNIIEFNSSFRPFFTNARYAMPNNVALAKRMVDRLHADGGTEMFSALKYALEAPVDDAYLRQILFITDGSVGNERELLSLIHAKLGTARLFTVAIGSAPNSYFMRKAAQFGRGLNISISKLSEVETSIRALLNRIKRPLMRDISVEWPHAVEQFPKKISDLYAGDPLMLVVKSPDVISHLKITGQLQGQQWSQKIKVQARSLDELKGDKDESKHALALDKLWARSKIESLSDELISHPDNFDQIRNSIIQLGLDHNVVSRFTSFVAVENEPSRHSDEPTKAVNVANLMPQGSLMSAPQTGTYANLLKLFGGLIIVCSIIWRFAPGFRWPAEIEA